MDYIEIGYRVNRAACPQCDSHSRHRSMYLWLNEEFQIADRAGSALIFAPEKALNPVWESATKLKVHRVDIVPDRGVNILADIMRLPFLTDSVDFIWCHHVLEQVPDDKTALAELSRVLRSDGGVLVLSVGMSNADVTQDFGFADKTLSGNWRRYGADFIGRMQTAGLNVKPITHKLSDLQRREFGIFPETFFYCTRAASKANIVRN